MISALYDAFDKDDELNDDWDLLSANVLCAAPAYERFAGFLVHTYLIPKEPRTPAFRSASSPASRASGGCGFA